MPFYQFKCLKCKQKIVKQDRDLILCPDCKEEMVRDFMGERAGPYPPFRAYWTEEITEDMTYVKDRETEQRMLNGTDFRRFR